MTMMKREARPKRMLPLKEHPIDKSKAQEKILATVDWLICMEGDGEVKRAMQKQRNRVAKLFGME
jgi:hypothetical protein